MKTILTLAFLVLSQVLLAGPGDGTGGLGGGIGSEETLTMRPPPCCDV